MGDRGGEVRKRLLEGINRYLEKEPGGPHMLVGAVAVIEFVDMDDGEPVITSIDVDGSGDIVPFWRVLGYAEYMRANALKYIPRLESEKD